MLTRRYFRLRTLGRLTLARVDVEGECPVDIRPRHLSVLAALATARRSVTRDALLEMFWGGESEGRARHSLSNSLSALRAVLGSEAITGRRDHVDLAEGCPLEVDAVRFVAACESRDDDQAVALYDGAFLDGVYVSDAPEFDAWRARERGRLEHLFLEACERHWPMLMRAGRWAEAAVVAERWAAAAPQSTLALISLLRAHSEAGTPAALTAAIAAYETHCHVLRDMYGAKPDATAAAAADSLRAQLVVCERELAAAAAPVVASRDASRPSPAEPPPPSRPLREAEDSIPRIWVPRLRRLTLAATAAVALVAVVGARALRRHAAVAAQPPRPVVAVENIEDTRGDTSIDWLRAGLPRMIAGNLETMATIDVVAPSRVRDLIVRLRGSDTARVDDNQALDVAHRLGASWAVTGGVSKGDHGYLLVMMVRDAESGRPAQSFTVLSDNPIELGRMAAARLATVLDAAGSGSPRYAGIETTSPEAYTHFMRGMLAQDGERLTDAARELDMAIALDSGFVDAIRVRRDVAGWLGDTLRVKALSASLRHLTSRMPEFERLSDQIRDVDSLGEGARAMALAERLVQRFPFDPRAFSEQADIVSGHGQWAVAESILVRELDLDSLAMAAGEGPCTPCEALSRLAQTRLSRGNAVGAEAAARRWVTLQPDLPSAWRSLSATLAAVGRASESVQAGFHYLALSRDEPAPLEFARIMLSDRRYDLVDSLLAVWRGSKNPVLVNGARDMRSMLDRERGQFAASVAVLPDAQPNDGMTLIRADGLARLGRLAEARPLWEESGHPAGSARTGEFTAPEARGFAWAHALEADAFARAGDTVVARTLVDSIARAGAQSYYDRDKRLSHHVLGMLAFAQHRWGDAERELEAAEWMAGGWTRTNIELARVQLAERHAGEAIVTLRNAYLAPMDAMGRYVPRSEIDWWMSRAFASAGQADSARVYATYVRAAWRDADPSVRALLDSLPKY